MQHPRIILASQAVPQGAPRALGSCWCSPRALSCPSQGRQQRMEVLGSLGMIPLLLIHGTELRDNPNPCSQLGREQSLLQNGFGCPGRGFQGGLGAHPCRALPWGHLGTGLVPGHPGASGSWQVFGGDGFPTALPVFLGLFLLV